MEMIDQNILLTFWIYSDVKRFITGKHFNTELISQ